MTIIKQVTTKRFVQSIQAWEAKEPEKAAFVDCVATDKTDYFMSPLYNAGFGVTNSGEIVSLFNDNGPKGIGMSFVKLAIDMGATYLWCFDGKLPELYSEHGFTVCDSIEWNEKYAPDNWNYSKYGTPNVVKMELQE
ncbi:hypothetical protein M1M34_gp065 [Haloarcula tailed virus 2]|uniref:Uncharacterized protein n=1 Tax=Haloarcula tailed virus 2 TaxID=2877989 RepID=A0AAE9BZB4_9CAUD|nr:hypothetical protein M1M34_gp065 [Haloarcula tailed virus 2]UBF23268.1 hypothetical protein HATV-2_gp117 [Haloarcula tailed virus 2]